VFWTPPTDRRRRHPRQICLKRDQQSSSRLWLRTMALCRAERWRSQRRTGAVELHAHVPLLIACCAPCDGPGLATGNGSAGITVAESASTAATIAADFIRRFCLYHLRRQLFANAGIGPLRVAAEPCVKRHRRS
jgi:hypothetical protein